MKNIDLLYDIEIKRSDGIIRKKTKPRRCHSFVRQFPDFLLKVFKLGYVDNGGSGVGNTQIIKDTSGTLRSGLYNNFLANGLAGDIRCGTTVGTGMYSIYITPDGGSVPYLTWNSGSGMIASASDEWNSNYAAYLAFNGAITADYPWRTSSAPAAWLELDTLSSDWNIATSYSVRCSNYLTEAPKDWTLEGSNDNSTWDVLDTVTNSTSWSTLENRTYNCDVATTPYRYFRINVSANNGSSSTSICELIIYRTAGVSVIPVTVNDYRLINQIVHGTSSGQLQYAAESFGAPVVDLATSSSYFVASRLFTNNSGGNVSINEIGLNLKGYYYNVYSYMIIRDIVDPINLAVGESVTVNYTMRMTA